VLSSGEFLHCWEPLGSPHMAWCLLALSSYSFRLDIPFFASQVVEQLATWFFLQTGQNDSLMHLLGPLNSVFFCCKVRGGRWGAERVPGLSIQYPSGD
jgi:hypothetical protein